MGNKELLRNGSGYIDLTAYQAINNAEKRKVSNMTCNHGDVIEYEMRTGEPRTAVVVSADWRSNDRFVNVIVLNEEPKGQVVATITTKNGVFYADCGMVSFAETNRCLAFIQTVKAAEMEALENGIANCLGFDIQSESGSSEYTVESPAERIVEKIVEIPSTSTDNAELIQAQAEAKIYKDLYEGLLAKVMG